MVKLGSKVKDLITGVEGVATQRTEFMYGCARILMVPTKLDKEGNPRKEMHLDEQRVAVTKENKKYKAKGFKYGLGHRVKDTISPFEGVIHARAENLYQTTYYTVEPTKLKTDGEVLDMVSFPEDRLELVAVTAPPVSKQSSATAGGPQRTATRSRC